MMGRISTAGIWNIGMFIHTQKSWMVSWDWSACLWKKQFIWNFKISFNELYSMENSTSIPHIGWILVEMILMKRHQKCLIEMTCSESQYKSIKLPMQCCVQWCTNLCIVFISIYVEQIIKKWPNLKGPDFSSFSQNKLCCILHHSPRTNYVVFCITLRGQTMLYIASFSKDKLCCILHHPPWTNCVVFCIIPPGHTGHVNQITLINKREYHSIHYAFNNFNCMYVYMYV